MSSVRLLLSLFAVLLALAMPRSAGAQTTEPVDPAVVASLKADLERLIEIQQSGGWRIDRYELEDMMPSALVSLCRVAVPAREALRAQLDQRILELGGPIEKAWAALPEKPTDGSVPSSLKPLLFVTRVRMLLVEAMKRAVTECPFYLVPDPSFRGLQSDTHRFSLSVETGGLVQIRRTEGRWTYGGGGVIRLLVARGFSRTSILFGPEFAGGAMLRPGAEDFVINYFPAFPFIFRIHDLSWHYDVEVAPVALFQADDTRRSYGLRFGIGAGVQSRRARGLIPWAGLAFAYETYFPGVRPSAQFLRGGLRVGFLWN